MTPAEAAIWAAAYGGAFAAEVRELERASDAIGILRTDHACDAADLLRCVTIANAALERLRAVAPNHPALVSRDNESAMRRRTKTPEELSAWVGENYPNGSVCLVHLGCYHALDECRCESATPPAPS